MASSFRRAPIDIESALLEAPWHFEFDQAVRLLARLDPDSAPVGHTDSPRREGVCFKSIVSSAFPSSDIAALERPDPDGPAHISVTFFGAGSPNGYGSLPIPYAEHAWECLSRGDSRFVEFLDLLNHRFLSLYHRAWEKYRHAILHEGAPVGTLTPFERAVLSLTGIDSKPSPASLPVDYRHILRNAHALRRSGVSARALEELLHAYFAHEFRVVQHVSRWFVLDDHDRTRLMHGTAQLGVDVVLGGMVEAVESSFRIQVGPLSWHHFQSFVKTGSAYHELLSIVRQSVGPELSFDIELLLAANERPQLVLCADELSPNRLGWSTWLGADFALRDCLSVVVGSCDFPQAGLN